MYDHITTFHRNFISACLGGCILITSACGTTAITTPVPQQSPCTPSDFGTNPYLTHEISPELSRIFSGRFSTLGTSRQDALAQLGKNVEHWSDQVDIALDDFNMIRIVITYLDPVLIQYIVLNHLLNAPNVQIDEPGFINSIHETMDRLGARDEMLFIVTITSPFYREQAYNGTVLTLRIPIEQMELISSGDLRVRHTHEDHILDENIDITHGPVSGIVGYPLGVVNQGECAWVIDQFTNTLTLDVPAVRLGNEQFNDQFWSIPYRPLVMESNNHQIPIYDPNYDWISVEPLKSPPTPSWVPNAQFDSTNRTVYWQEMGRYIWSLVIIESHH